MTSHTRDTAARPCSSRWGGCDASRRNSTARGFPPKGFSDARVMCELHVGAPPARQGSGAPTGVGRMAVGRARSCRGNGAEPWTGGGRGEERAETQQPSGGQRAIVGTHVAAGRSLPRLAPGRAAPCGGGVRGALLKCSFELPTGPGSGHKPLPATPCWWPAVVTGAGGDTGWGVSHLEVPPCPPAPQDKHFGGGQSWVSAPGAPV